MSGHFGALFSTTGLMPHGMCYQWEPDLLALHVTADAAITLAYFSMPFTLFYFVRRRPDLQFNWIFVCFAVFIVACGATHLMEIWTLWQPLHWLSGAVKALAALVCVSMAILLARLVPKALRWPSPAALQRANATLEREIAERERAEAAVRRSNELLEIRIAERSRELETAYCSLRETQQAKLQQDRLQALGRMASGIAHDINNALTPAALYTQSLLDHDPSLSPDARSDLRFIQQAIQDVARTIGRIRDFYRGRDANVTGGPVQIDLVLDQVIDLTRARWSSMSRSNGAPIEVRRDYATQLPAILGVQGEIRDALINLVLNAVDFMPEGGTLTLRSYGTQYQVTVEICDTGVGMSEEVRSRCLDPFFSTKSARGSGLGLTMVYGMAERLGAVLDIDSEPGAGTVVRLIFPVAPATGSTGATTRTLQRKARSLRILVIDDDDLARQSMRAILEREGHQVSVAQGGSEGIDLFTGSLHRGEPFDTVITDLAMPHMDGRAVASAVKQACPGVPVLLLTGWGEHLGYGAGLPPDVDHLLNKPTNLGQLRALLAELELPGGGSVPLAAHGRD